MCDQKQEPFGGTQDLGEKETASHLPMATGWKRAALKAALTVDIPHLAVLPPLLPRALVHARDHAQARTGAPTFSWQAASGSSPGRLSPR